MTRKRRNRYWEERAAAERKWQEEQLKGDADFAKILNRPYQVAADEINKEIADKAAKIGGIQNMVKPEDMAEYERLAQEAVQKANRLRALHGHVNYTDFSDDVNRRLKLYNATMQINQLELLKSTMGVHLVDLGMETQTSIGNKLYGDYLKERKRQAGILGMAANARSQKVTTATLDSIPSSVAGAEFSKRVWSNVDLLKANLDGILATGFVRGDSVQDMTRYIKKRVGDTMKTGSYAAERLARTESARVQFEAQQESLKDNDYKHCKWYAEPGACSICREIAEGRSNPKYPEGIYDVDDVPDIPVHPNCRCSIGAYWIDDNEIADKPIADKVEDTVNPRKLFGDIVREAKMSIEQADRTNANVKYYGLTPEAQAVNQQLYMQMRPLREWLDTNRHTAQTSNSSSTIRDYNNKVDQFNKLVRAFRKGTEAVSDYHVNCQRCVPAYELRRRGYDVEALPRPHSRNWDEVYGIPKHFWRNADGTIARPKMLAAKTNKQVTRELMAKMEPGERGTLSWCWTGQNEGHIINVERTKDGLKFVDTQVGRMADTFEEYMGKNKFRRSLYNRHIGVDYNRVDDKAFDIKNAAKVVKKHGR